MNIRALFVPAYALSFVACAAPDSRTLTHHAIASSASMPGTKVPSSLRASSHHVKAFGGQLESADGTGSTVSVSADAILASGIQALEGWRADHDESDAAGATSGTSSIVSSPSRSGAARRFVTAYTNYGDERYSVVFGSDAAATHFFYEAWIYIASPADGIANLEMDMNQVMANGQTVIYGVQCDGYSGTWDYTANAGTPEGPIDTWVHTAARCNPREWSTDRWHQVQIAYERDDAGNVTYESVWLDGTRQDMNATAPSAFALGWGPVLLTNFQVDGLGASGSSTVYIDDLNVYRW